jgi:hypothetical protein
MLYYVNCNLLRLHKVITSFLDDLKDITEADMQIKKEKDTNDFLELEQLEPRFYSEEHGEGDA